MIDDKKCEDAGIELIERLAIDATRARGVMVGEGLWVRELTPAEAHSIKLRGDDPRDLVVVDVNDPEGGKALDSLCAKHGALPSTLRSRTSRGMHYYFRCFGGPKEYAQIFVKRKP